MPIGHLEGSLNGIPYLSPKMTMAPGANASLASFSLETEKKNRMDEEESNDDDDADYDQRESEHLVGMLKFFLFSICVLEFSLFPFVIVMMSVLFYFPLECLLDFVSSEGGRNQIFPPIVCSYDIIVESLFIIFSRGDKIEHFESLIIARRQNPRALRLENEEFDRRRVVFRN